MAEGRTSSFQDIDDDEDGLGDDDAWNECDEDIFDSPTKCLFCEEVSDSVKVSFEHCKAKHGFDILCFSRALRFDCFTFIKMINFIRVKHPNPSEVMSYFGSKQRPWDSDEFMIPSQPDDPILQYDIEGMEDDTDHDAGGDNGAHGIPSEYLLYQKRAQAAEERARLAEEELGRVLQDLEKVRTVAKNFMLSQPLTSLAENQSDNTIATITEDEDEAYFSSYAHFSIHEEMLKDKVRTESYRDFMFQNEALFKDKIVLDVGCGTGILSMFAAKAGAKHVIAVDQSEVIFQAMDIVKENGLENVITFKKGRLEDVELPEDKVDIIISEWMGYFLLFESMLDTVLYARDKHLKPGGVVFPDRCTMSVVGLDDSCLYDKHVTFWDDVYGFKMSCMKKEVVREASVEIVSQQKIITEPCMLKDMNICDVRTADLNFVADISLNVTRDGNIMALVGYFEIFFERGCESPISFSTSPGSPYTHWKQTVFLLDTPIAVNKDDILRGKLTCKKNRKDPRSLIIQVTLQGNVYTFLMQ